MTSEIVYDQAVRAVSQQERQLDEIHSRAAIVLAASGVVSAFLGRTVVERGLGPFGLLAILAFLASALACVWVLLPRWKCWAFSINAKKLMPYFLNEDAPEPAEALYSYLAEQIQTDYEENGSQLEHVYGGFALACAFLAVEVVLWLLALGLD
jgi:hypothetical protein